MLAVQLLLCAAGKCQMVDKHTRMRVTLLCVLLIPADCLQFEMRYNEIERARAVFERYVDILPTVKAWVR